MGSAQWHITPFESDKPPVKILPSPDTKLSAVPFTVEPPKFAVLEKRPVVEISVDVIERLPEKVAEPLVGRVEGFVKPILFQYAKVFCGVALFSALLHAMRSEQASKIPGTPIRFQIIAFDYNRIIKEIENSPLRHFPRLNSVRGRFHVANF